MKCHNFKISIDLQNADNQHNFLRTYILHEVHPKTRNLIDCY